MAEQPPTATSNDRSRLQRQARALGNPTRFAMFEYVAALHHPVQVAALVDRFGLNHNVIRQHLAKLCEADLFVEEFAPRNGPGRPALQYRLAPEVAVTWGMSSPYEHVALLLLEMTAEGLSPREVGRRAGRRAAATAGRSADTAVGQLVADLRRKGFDARSRDGANGGELVLGRCPVSGGVPGHREILCEIHLGYAEGFLHTAGSDLTVAGIEPDKADETSCTIQLDLSPEAGR